jgi:transposase-like protein
MATCKRCGCEQSVKNGKVRGKARYKCKKCGLNFVEGDERVNESLVVKITPFGRTLALDHHTLTVVIGVRSPISSPRNYGEFRASGK